MNTMSWKMLITINDRMEAEMIKAALEALEIPVELMQESAGYSLYPVGAGLFSQVQIFVPANQLEEAQDWLNAYYEDQLDDSETLE